MSGESRSLALLELVRANFLQQNQAEYLFNRALSGEHSLFIGPHRSGRLKLAQALASDVEKITRVWTIEEVADRDAVASGVSRARLAGADYIFFPEIGLAELLWLITREPTMCIVAALPVASKNAFRLFLTQWEISLKQAFIVLKKSVDPNMYSIGYDQSGHARLDGICGSSQQKAGWSSAARTSSSVPLGWDHETDTHDPGWELDEFLSEKKYE